MRADRTGGVAVTQFGLLSLVAMFACGGSGRSAPKVISGFGTRAGVHRDAEGFLIARSHPHTGVDLRAGIGDVALASAEGFVVRVNHSPGAGLFLILCHPVESLCTGYAHLQSVSVAPGEWVQRGQHLGAVGLFPFSGGIPHLHWELCRGVCDSANSSRRDPLRHTAGCFRSGIHYSRRGGLVLTYPLAC